MRFRKIKHELGTTVVKDRFAIFPKTIRYTNGDRETRWLEKVKYEKTYDKLGKNYYGWYISGWLN
jgi:hypothetical protein